MPARKFQEEGPNLYGKYLRGRISWAEMPSVESPGEIYSGGYLPYSGDTDDPRNLFYMARSLRVKVDAFSLEKKRRYDQRMWDQFGLSRAAMPKEAFIGEFGQEMTTLAYKWMEPRFGKASLARERFSYILSKDFLNTILTWRNGGELVAFALVAQGNWGAHYWYVFYANATGSPCAPGHGYLVDFLQWTKSENLPFAYLGTIYGTKSRYKSRGIRGLSFWDGAAWNNDRSLLASLLEEDDSLEPVNTLPGP